MRHLANVVPLVLRAGVGSATALTLVWACTPDRATSPHARADPPAASASIAAGPYTPGQSYFSTSGYIEYVAGNLPIILSAPHGGPLRPAGMPDRNCGKTKNDPYTEELARAMYTALHERTGKYPHLIINRLARIKLDANRDSAEATCGNPGALPAWHDWHAFIGVAKQAVLSQYGTGLYVDVHGHFHPIPRLELGYRVADSAYYESNATLDANPTYEANSSIRTLSERSPLSFSALLRGPSSLGALYVTHGYPAVPSPSQPDPGGDTVYRQGAYNMERHGCAAGGRVCGIQLETYYYGVRSTAAERAAFARVTAKVLDLYLFAHYGMLITPRRAVWPTSGRTAADADTIVDQYGPRIYQGQHQFSTGVSIKKARGLPAVAAMRGVVIKVGPGEILIRHGDSLFTGYRYVENPRVTAGQPVDAGDRIGSVGATATGFGMLRFYYLKRLANNSLDFAKARNPLEVLPHSAMRRPVAVFGSGAGNDSVFFTFSTRTASVRSVTLEAYAGNGSARTVDYYRVVARSTRSDTIQRPDSMYLKTVVDGSTSFRVKFAPALRAWRPRRVVVKDFTGAVLLDTIRP